MIFKPVRNSIWALHLYFNGFHNELKILRTKNNTIKKNKVYSYKLVSLTLCCIIVSFTQSLKKNKAIQFMSIKLSQYADYSNVALFNQQSPHTG